MKTFFRNCFFPLICMLLNVVNAQPDKVAEVMKRLNEGLNQPLVAQDYTNGIESAIAFLEHIDSLQSEASRSKIVRFSAELFYKSKVQNSQQSAKEVDTFISLMVSLMETDTSYRVRSEAARSLRKVASPELVDRHHSSVLNAYEKHKDLEILLLYASLPSCQQEKAVKMARAFKTESMGGACMINSILARFGDQSAMDALIAKAENISEIGGLSLFNLLSALAFTHSDKIKRFLVKGLRAEDYITLAGGSKIPRRNCYAKALALMNMHNEKFPVKNKYGSFSADDLDRIEQWYAGELGMNIPRAPRKEMPEIPSFEPIAK
ncbi:MAG: hypothetical protein GX946_11245 [Oligosphaeraceae bacterium]|nr:hypothetical protein [Oligosphaeraceae bacterium]